MFTPVLKKETYIRVLDLYERIHFVSYSTFMLSLSVVYVLQKLL